MGLYEGLEQNLLSERLSLGMYGLHVKSRTFITHVYILRSYIAFWESMGKN